MMPDTLLKCQSECSNILITYSNKEDSSSGEARGRRVWMRCAAVK